MAAMLWVPEHVLTSSDPFGDEYDATGLGTPVHLAGDVHELMDIRPITQAQHVVRWHLSDSAEILLCRVRYAV